MQRDTMRTGAVCAVIAAALYLIVGVNHFLWPAAATPDALMQVLVEQPIHHYVTTLGLALIAALLIPVITAVGVLLQPVHAGVSRWATVVAYIGAAGMIMSNLRLAHLAPLRAAVYLEGDDTVRAAIQYNWIGNSLDPHGWLQFGLIGAWLLAVAILVLRGGNVLPRGYGYMTLLGALVNLLALAANLSAALPGFILAGLGGVVVGPTWALWTGMLLSRSAGAVGAAASGTAVSS
ncbi:MAG TPA: hypothetical protein VF282_12195 [Bacillota bacterium]